jgi:hypothetical protein
LDLSYLASNRWRWGWSFECSNVDIDPDDIATTETFNCQGEHLSQFFLPTNLLSKGLLSTRCDRSHSHSHQSRGNGGLLHWRPWALTRQKTKINV